MGLDRLAWIFSKLQVKMLGSGGTAEAVRKLGFNILEVSEYTQVLEMPRGLVKTLHPKIHGGIFGDRKEPGQGEHLEANLRKPPAFGVGNPSPFHEVLRGHPDDPRIPERKI